MGTLSVNEILYVRFGTVYPIWKYHSNSNVLRIGGMFHEINSSIELNYEQIDVVRSFGDEISSFCCVVNLFGEIVEIFLVGKRVMHWVWGGVASDLADLDVAIEVMKKITKSPF
jgi:hypothetical protein